MKTSLWTVTWMLFQRYNNFRKVMFSVIGILLNSLNHNIKMKLPFITYLKGNLSSLQ